MRKKLLLIFLAIFAVMSLTQCQSESSKPTSTLQSQPTKQPQSTKRAAPQTPQSQKPEEKPTVIQYSTVPFDITLNKVPADYKGHDLELLYKSLREKLLEKGELETTENYKKRIERVTKEPLFGQLTGQSTFAFVLNLLINWKVEDLNITINEVKYDADHKVLKIYRVMGDVPFSLQDFKADINTRNEQRVIYTSNQKERTVRTYVGENAFGVKRQIIVKEGETYYLVFTNTRQFNFKKQDKFDWNTNMTFDVPMDVETAQKVKSNLKLLVLFQVTTPFVGEDKDYSGPDINNPIEVTTYKHYVFTKVSDIWLYDSVTGHVYTKLTPKKK